MARLNAGAVLGLGFLLVSSVSADGCCRNGQDGPKKQHVVLICGDVAGEGYTEFWCDTARMYETFASNGIEPQAIHVLYGLGADWTCLDNPAAHVFPTDITDFAATKTNVESVFKGLADGDQIRQIEQVGAKDTLIVWTFGHGFPNLLELFGGDLSPSELKTLVDKVECENKIFLMQQCFSGDFVGPLTSGNNHTTVLTAAGHHMAYDGDDSWENSDPCETGEFNYYLMNALASSSPAGLDLALCDQDQDNTICSREARDATVPGDGLPLTTINQLQGVLRSNPQYADSSGGAVGSEALTGH